MSYLKAENIFKKYGDVTALDDFSLEIDRGEIYALVGPDGAGKTSFIRIMCHLIDLDKGSAEIAGHDILKDFDQIKPILGYMPQVFSLYPDLSVEENLQFYAGIYGMTGETFRKKRDFLYDFSNLAPFANRRAAALSGGMKQKLALSCALMHDPEILILDEPTTGVDPLSRRQFWEILKELRNQGITILVTTPYMDEVARADRASFVFKGKIIKSGTPDKLPENFLGQIYFTDQLPSHADINTLDQIEGLSVQRFGSSLHIYIESGQPLESYRDELKQHGLELAQLQPIQADLEDLFIQLVEEKA